MKKREENDAVLSTYFFFFIGGDEKEGRGGKERQRDRGRGRKVGGRTDLRSEKKFISINNHKKKSWQTSSENWHGFLEAGSSKLKRQI